MNSTSNSDNPSEDFNGYAYYSAGLSLGFLLLMMFIVLTSYYCSRRILQNSQSRVIASSSSSSHRRVMERDSAVTIQVDQQEAILNSYPVLLYDQAKLHSHKPDSTTLCCSICLADYKDSEWLRLLPDCGHFFHRECIDMWWRLNLSCPMCRNSPFPTPLSTTLAEVAPLATRPD